MPPSFSSDPVFGGIFVLTVGILFLIRENLYLRKRLRDHVRDTNEVIRDDRELISEMEREIVRLSGLLSEERNAAQPVENQVVSREVWACAVMGLNPDKIPFSSNEIADARKKAIKRAHPDQGGAGRIDDIEIASRTLYEGRNLPA